MSNIKPAVFVVGRNPIEGFRGDPERVECVDLREEGPSPQWRCPEREAFTPMPGWQDPYSGRAMTVGEFGCAASHVAAWMACDEWDRNTIVLEQDARLRVDVSMVMDVYQSVGRTGLVVYLSQRNYEGGVHRGHMLHEVKHHPLWTMAYVITPEAARDFLRSLRTHEYLIPADDLMPALMGIHREQVWNREYQTVSRVECLSTHQRYFDNPAGSGGSTTERAPYVEQDNGFTTLTVATDEDNPGYQRLKRSAQRYGHNLVNLGAGVEWQGGDMDGPGGGQKMLLVREYLEAWGESSRPYLFVDGYDTIMQAHASDLLKHWEQVTETTKVLVAGEATCWPDEGLAGRFPGFGPCPYPNSGIYMGTCHDLQILFSHVDKSQADFDDQLYLHQRMLTETTARWRYVIDHGQQVFCCLNHNPEALTVDTGRGQLVVGGDRWPYVVHANGPTKDRLEGDLAGIGGRIRDYYGDIER